MSSIWDHLIRCQETMTGIFDSRANRIEEPGMEKFNQDGWVNLVWANDSVRRAHIDVVDARDTKGLWMMHVCVFPQLHNDAPIYGFDVIAGKKKMTGAFHDFSPSSGGDDHKMVKQFRQFVHNVVPSKQRNLPEWAQAIFSDSMVAAGNVSDEAEAWRIINLAISNLNFYMDEVHKYNYYGNRDITIAAQQHYCDNQRKNPHTPRVMKSLGLDEQDVETFCRDMLFPDIE